MCSFVVKKLVMAGLASLMQPSLEQGTFAIITLVTGIVTKVPAELSPVSSDGKATFNINRQARLCYTTVKEIHHKK